MLSHSTPTIIVDVYVKVILCASARRRSIVVNRTFIAIISCIWYEGFCFAFLNDKCIYLIVIFVVTCGERGQEANGGYVDTAKGGGGAST
jgi:hypothetical protein